MSAKILQFKPLKKCPAKATQLRTPAELRFFEEPSPLVQAQLDSLGGIALCLPFSTQILNVSEARELACRLLDLASFLDSGR